MAPSTSKQIRALFTESSVRVYQAYSNAIADPALQAGRFVSPPFKMSRMTWIKPSFLWMMYRSGWATKPGQERILGIDITREGFEWALTHSCLTHFDPDIYPSRADWLATKYRSPVRIQWDPERDLELRLLDSRSIQIGLSGIAVQKYLDQWIQHIEDLTGWCHELHELIVAGKLEEARRRLPAEKVMSVGPEARAAVGLGKGPGT